MPGTGVADLAHSRPLGQPLTAADGTIRALAFGPDGALWPTAARGWAEGVDWTGRHIWVMNGQPVICAAAAGEREHMLLTLAHRS
jgi:hypothetical protein